MKITEMLEMKVPKAVEYASRIIFETNNFTEFAVALTDYMGEDFIPYCKLVYILLRETPHSVNLKFESEDSIARYTPKYIEKEFIKFKRIEEQRQREQEFKENIDELQFLVKSYRDSLEFKKLLDFVGRFNYLAPYNAMLVQMQKPGAKFVFNGKKWADFGRRPKINGQKLIILKPFGPIQCVFDFSDTEPIPNFNLFYDEKDLMESWNNSLMQTKGEIDNKIMDNLYQNLILYGIYLDDEFHAANTYGGYIMPYTDKTLLVKIDKDNFINESSRFIISVNRSQKNAVKFHTICHELGHLFCYHLSYNPTKRRKLTLKEREFEAETVAWLVCKRYGIKNPSEEYLAAYAPNGEIPICSTDLIMKAVTEIEKMLNGKVKIKDSLWYKEDKKFKERVTKQG